MKIKYFKQFLLEALKDEIPTHQATALKKIHGDDVDKYLNLDINKKAENIKEGKWTLTIEEKNFIINTIFDDIADETEIESELALHTKYDQHFIEIFNKSITNPNINFDFPKNSFEIANKLELFHENNFYAINIKETKSNKKVLRDENGLPIMIDGIIQKEPKEVNEVIFTKNKTNYTNFLSAYNSIFINKEINNLLDDYYVNNFYSRCKEIIDLNLFTKFDVELYISSKPSDILNMSISKFYDSCQNLYNGEMNYHLLSNVFDANMKIAYLMFNTPFTDKKGNINPITPIARCIIRNIKGKTYFDQVYPTLENNDIKFSKKVHNIITKYTGMKSYNIDGEYYFTSPDSKLPEPYMDNLSSNRIVESDEYKILIKYLTEKYNKLKSNIDIEDSDLNIFSYNDKQYYVVKNTDDNFIYLRHLFMIRKHISKEELLYLNTIFLKYFDTKEFAKDDGIEKDIINSIKDIINNAYNGDIVAFLYENDSYLLPNKIKKDKCPIVTLLYAMDGLCHKIEDYNIYEVIY